MLELLLLAGGATLLLITSLGLILVRRTMVPLEQLTAGTRRLAGGDWSVRVDDARGDEFGQLARQFNAMVEGQHRQLEAMTVQAAIDRELLGEVDLPRVMQQVVSRLQALAPGAGVAVVAQSVDGRDWQLHRPGLPATACEGPPETLQREPEADALLLAIRDRETQLDDKAAQLADRAQALSVAEQKLKEQLAAFETAQRNLEGTLAQADKAAERDIDRMTTVYENMKPGDAARIFERMDVSFAAGLLARMRPEITASVLAGMEPDAAYAVTLVIASRNSAVPTQ